MRRPSEADERSGGDRVFEVGQEAVPAVPGRPEGFGKSDHVSEAVRKCAGDPCSEEGFGCLVRGHLPETAEILLEHILDQGPARRHVLDRCDPAQVDDETLERLDMALLAFGERYRLPELQAAATAKLLVAVEDNELPPSAHWQCSKRPFEPPLKGQLGPTASAPPMVECQLYVVIDRPALCVSTKGDDPPGGDSSSHSALLTSALPPHLRDEPTS